MNLLHLLPFHIFYYESLVSCSSKTLTKKNLMPPDAHGSYSWPDSKQRNFRDRLTPGAICINDQWYQTSHKYYNRTTTLLYYTTILNLSTLDHSSLSQVFCLHKMGHFVVPKNWCESTRGVDLAQPNVGRGTHTAWAILIF